MPKKNRKKVAETAPKEEKEEPKKAPLKSPLTAAMLREFRTLLLERRRKIHGDVSSLEAEGLRKSSDASGNLSTLPVHLADIGSDAFDQEMTLGRMESEGDELEEIEEAIRRVAEGVYGRCENCEKPIPKLRLKAIPYARYCIPCQTKEEGR